MSQRTARDRLLDNLAPEQRPYFERCIHRLSPNPDDPLIALFAIITETDSSNRSLIEAKLSAFEQLEKQRDGQHARDRKEYLKAISMGFEALRGKTLWKHLIASRFIAAIIWTITVAGLTNHIIQTKMETVDPEFHDMIKQLQVDSSAQKGRLDQVMRNQAVTVEYVSSVLKTTSLKATDTIVGQTMAIYITTFDRNSITLAIPDKSVAQGFRMVSLPHKMSEDEYLKFELAYTISKEVK